MQDPRSTSLDTCEMNDNLNTLCDIALINCDSENMEISNQPNTNNDNFVLNTSILSNDSTIKQMKIRKSTDEYTPAKKTLKTKAAKQIATSMKNPKPIQTHNKFQILTTATPTDCHNTISNTTPCVGTSTTPSNINPAICAVSKNTISQPKPKKPPPIILLTKVNYFDFAKQLKQFLREEINAQYCPQGLKIFAANNDDYNDIGNYLKANSYEFYTFPNGQVKVHKVVMKGLPVETSSDTILNELVLKKFSVQSVKQMKKKIIDDISGELVSLPIPVWIITTYQTPGTPDIHTLTGLFNLKLNIEDYKSLQGPIQCFRCQGFGHKAVTCFVQPKCVKCGNAHFTYNCDAVSEAIPKCANCNAQHTANFKNCPKFLKYTQGIQNKREQSINNFTLRDQDFPRLPNRNPTPYRNHNQDTLNKQRDNSSTIEDLQDIWNFTKNIRNYIQKFKSIMSKIKSENNTLTKIGILIEGLIDILDLGNGSE